ncbi:MAG: HAMP domain-containing histidine kinase [Acidobacteria bacterium]|nr:HAMP domain-containing histidine kinase [Acidobacteriota bacterium]
MDPGGGRASLTRSWWLALAAVVVCGPWPGWAPTPLALAAVVAGLAVLARPRHRALVPWAAVILAVPLAIGWHPHPPDRQQLADRLSEHCEGMLGDASRVAVSGEVRRVFAATGEVADPERLFRALDRMVGRSSGRSAYLSDDRGQLVAWSGVARELPPGVRPIGQRRWSVTWWAGSAALAVREPVMFEGRLVGAVTVVDRSPLLAHSIWGMRVGRGWLLSLGTAGNQARDLVQADRFPGVSIPVALRREALPGPAPARWLPWGILILIGTVWLPSLAPTAVVAGGLAAGLAWHAVPPLVVGLGLLLGGSAIWRCARNLPAAPARLLVLTAMAAIPVSALLLPSTVVAEWLPRTVFRPGWGAAWAVAAAWLATGWLRYDLRRRQWPRARLVIPLSVGVLMAVTQGLRVPEQIQAAEELRTAPSPPAATLDLGDLLPAPLPACHLSDLAPVLAKQWKLDRWQRPVMLVVVDPEGAEISRWGVLNVGRESTRLLRTWALSSATTAVGTAQLWAAVPPWSWLRGWPAGGVTLDGAAAAVWFAALTRAGHAVASEREEIRGLGPEVAGKLFHAGGGWVLVGIGSDRRLAHVARHGDWLVAAVANYPSLPVWLLRSLLASLWAAVALLIAFPPRLRRDSLSTFGGRLRLLVVGGVVLPLVLLTLFLHQRLRQEEVRLARVIGGDGIQAARWTSQHLEGGLPVNADLAKWLARQVGGEVVLFDGANVAATSRPDLLTVGALPGLPDPVAFSRFQLGRSDPVVRRTGRQLLAAGGVSIEGRSLLLEMFLADPVRRQAVPGVIDWLLVGALLSAMLTLFVTSRVEGRVGASLRDLVELARRLQRGDPVGQVPRPAERDLAEVLDAVQLMSLEVQRRETSLRSQEELLRITLSTLAQAVLVLDADSTVRFANPSAKTLLEAEGDVVVRHVTELAERSGEDGRPVVVTVQPFPGTDVTWRLGVAGVPLPDGTRGLVAVVDDVSDVVRADRLQQLAQLARIVAHEVKNPLTPIRLWVQELEDAMARRDQDRDVLLREACVEITTQVERLQQMASSFSNLVALERWEAEEVAVTDLIDSALSGLGILQRRGIHLVRDTSGCGRCSVVGDRQWLRRALGNLIQNSVDAVDEGPGEITVRARCTADTVTIEVRDTGGGVPPDQLHDLFNPHFSTTSSGTGLGLALVRQVVSRCHGSVTAANGAKGLVVCLELPRSAGTAGPLLR